MATYTPEDLASKELYCPICFEDYDFQDARRTPKLLLCLHTFCFDCTRKLRHADGSLECSICRMNHEQVCLDDLFDNHVIIQHLRREFEERDMELARRLDHELRSEDNSVNESDPVIVWENVPNPEPEPLETSPSSVSEDPDISLEAEESNMEGGNDILANFFAGLVEEHMVHQGAVDESEEEEEQEEEEGDSDDDESDDVDNEDNLGQSVEILQPQNEDSAIEVDEVDAENVISFHNFHTPSSEDDDNDDSESDGNNGDNHFLSMDIFQRLLSVRNENSDEDEEDEDRWHSACDDIVSDIWNESSVPLNNASEVDNEDSDNVSWQIESYLED